MEKQDQIMLNVVGRCFFCLDLVASPNQTSDETTSLSNVYQYLKLNLKGLEGCEGDGLPHSLKFSGVLKRPEVRGRLCDECDHHAKHFSRLFLELEAVQMKLQHSLKSIYERMSKAEGAHQGAFDKFCQEVTTQPGKSSIQHEMVRELRQKTVDRCSNLLQKGSPTVRLTCDVSGPMQLRRVTTTRAPTPEDEPEEESPQLPEPVTAECDSGWPSELMKCDMCHVKVPDLSTHLYTAHFETETAAQVKVETGTVLEEQDPSELLFCQVQMREEDDGGEHNPGPDGREHATSWPETPIMANREDDRPANASPKIITRIKCSLCNKTFAHTRGLKQHQQTIHFGRRWQCKFCSKLFSQSSCMNLHMRKKCRMRVSQVGQDPEYSDTNCTIRSPSPTPASTPPRPASPPSPRSPSPIEPVYIPALTLVAAVAHRTVSSAGVPIPIKVEEDDQLGQQRFKCHVCDKTFPHAVAVRRHWLNVHRGKQFQCKFCGKPFTQASSRNKHMKGICPKRGKVTIAELKNASTKKQTKSTGVLSSPNGSFNFKTGNGEQCQPVEPSRDAAEKVVRLKCKYCDKQFDNAKGMKTHLTTIHFNSNQTTAHECDVCFKRFNFRPSLRIHMQTAHYGKRFPCQFCGKNFTQSSSRSLHLRKNRCTKRPI